MAIGASPVQGYLRTSQDKKLALPGVYTVIFTYTRYGSDKHNSTGSCLLSVIAYAYRNSCGVICLLGNIFLDSKW